MDTIRKNWLDLFIEQQNGQDFKSVMEKLMSFTPSQEEYAYVCSFMVMQAPTKEKKYIKGIV